MFYFWASVLTWVVVVAILRDADCQCGPTNDETLNSGATGTDVVLATVRKIRASSIGIEDDGEFLRRMAAVETDDGRSFEHGQGGIWRVSARIFREVFNTVRFSNAELIRNVRNDPCLEWSKVQGYMSLDIPLYSALFVTIRLHMIGKGKKIDDDPVVQGRLWRDNFNPTGDPKVFEKVVERLMANDQVKVDECDIPGVDMIFVMDESGSIGRENFEIMKELAIDITDNFTIGPQDTQVGWISFNHDSEVKFNLSEHKDKESLHEAIRNVSFSSGGTNIGNALLTLHDLGFHESAGARNTFDIPEVAIVVTDGQSSLRDIEFAAMLLRDNRNVNVFAIGIGSGVVNETLEAIALAGITNDTTHVYRASGFIENELRILQQTIKARACFDVLFKDHDATVKELMNQGVHSVPQGASLHINVECPEEGLTINACGREGRVIIYLSGTVSRPSSAGYDRKIEIAEGECHNTFIECEGSSNNGRRRRQAESEERIFMTIEGQSEENEYELQAMVGDHSTPQVNLACRKAVAEDRSSLVITCNSDRELTDIDCSINNYPYFSCSLPWTVSFTPPVREYNFEIQVMDSLNLTASINITHSVGPLTLLCSLNEDTEIECISNNELDPNNTICSFRGNTIEPCILPLKVDVRGLPVGAHKVQVNATDYFGSTVSYNFDYMVVADRIGDDMVFSTVVNINPIDVGITSDTTISLCYQVHGKKEAFYNLVSDECLSINAHVHQPIPDIDRNVINSIGVLAMGNNGSCYDIAIIREGCSVFINNKTLPLNSRFEEDGVMVLHEKTALKPTMIHISVPNCGRVLIDMMYITCSEYRFSGVTDPVEALEFETCRGLSPIMPAQGLVGQFWGRFATCQPQTPPSPQRQRYDMAMTILHEESIKQFGGFLNRGWSQEMCFYAGDRQGGSVIQGDFSDYKMKGFFGIDYPFSLFDHDKCPNISHIWDSGP